MSSKGFNNKKEAEQDCARIIWEHIHGENDKKPIINNLYNNIGQNNLPFCNNDMLRSNINSLPSQSIYSTDYSNPSIAISTDMYSSVTPGINSVNSTIYENYDDNDYNKNIIKPIAIPPNQINQVKFKKQQPIFGQDYNNLDLIHQNFNNQDNIDQNFNQQGYSNFNLPIYQPPQTNYNNFTPPNYNTIPPVYSNTSTDYSNPSPVFNNPSPPFNSPSPPFNNPSPDYNCIPTPNPQFPILYTPPIQSNINQNINMNNNNFSIQQTMNKANEPFYSIANMSLHDILKKYCKENDIYISEPRTYLFFLK